MAPYIPEIMTYKSTTLHTPKTEGVTASGEGVVISYYSGGSYAVQFCIAQAASSAFYRDMHGKNIWSKWIELAAKEPLKYWQPKNVKSFNTERCWYVKNGNLLTIQFQVETFEYVSGEAQLNLETNVKNAFGISNFANAFTTCFSLSGGVLVLGMKDNMLYIQILGSATWKDGAQIYGQISTYFT